MIMKLLAVTQVCMVLVASLRANEGKLQMITPLRNAPFKYGTSISCTWQIEDLKKKYDFSSIRHFTTRKIKQNVTTVTR